MPYDIYDHQYPIVMGGMKVMVDIWEGQGVSEKRIFKDSEVWMKNKLLHSGFISLHSDIFDNHYSWIVS